MRIRFIPILLFSFLVTPLYAASFECNKATTETEKAICSDPELSALDALMGHLWREQGAVSKSQLQEQKEWLDKRNLCRADFKCLKSSYQTLFKSINFPHLIYDNFQLINLYDFSLKSFGQYFLAKGFGGSYNWTYYVISVNDSRSKILSWFIPKFDENYIETCNINHIDGQGMLFQSNAEVHGWIEEVDHDVISETQKEIKVYTQWVGHGDWSSEINYRLIEGTFVPVRGKVDNCTDGQVKYSNINFESVK